MKDYKYKFSVVMAVYNVEEYLAEAIDSIVNQNIGFEDNVQLILIDDGSIDKSGIIADEYAKKYPMNITVIHKENGGVSSARNEGLKHIEGKYVNFMDSDDKFELNVLKEVYSFFETHYDETDIVSIPLEFFDAKTGGHWQNFKFSAGNRIVNLNKYYDTPEMFVNSSFFKCSAIENVIFDSHLVIAEDMKFILSVIWKKMRIGLINTCRYLYRKRSGDSQSLVQTSKKKYGWYFDYFTYLIDWGLYFYKEKFGVVPKFLQYIFMCDLQWRIIEKYDMKGILSDEESYKYKNILFGTISKFDDHIIFEQKKLHLEHKCYLISKKYGITPRIRIYDNKPMIFVGDIAVCKLEDTIVYLDFIKDNNDSFILEGRIPRLLTSNGENLEVFLYVGEKPVKCDIGLTNIFDTYIFEDICCSEIIFKCRIYKNNLKDNINILIGGSFEQTNFIYKKIITTKHFPIVSGLWGSYVHIGEFLFRFINNRLFINEYSLLKHIIYEGRYMKWLAKGRCAGARKNLALRMMYYALKPFMSKDIWLISDRINKADDNGEAFFKYLNDNNIKQNRYFVIGRDSADYSVVKQYGKVLDHYSLKHRIIHMFASKIISSAGEDNVWAPYWNNGQYIRDILYKQRRIFLQHGIIKNDLSVWLNKFNKNIDLFFTSSEKEYESIIKGNYLYDASVLKLTGLARYDRLNDCREKTITIMPTWRANLIDGTNYGASGKDKLGNNFLRSTYFEFYNNLLNSKKLLNYSYKNGYKIKFMPHPRIIPYVDYFTKNKIVEFCDIRTHYRDIFSESSLVITDYSSAVFDFSYLRKPIIYSQFDKEVFYNAQIYDKGYFDDEHDGFGEVEYDLESTVDRIIEYMKNDCKLKEKYRERIDKFFAFNDQKNCERIYNEIIKL